MLKFFEYIWFYDYSFITQHEALLMLRIAHQIENVNAPIDMNFNSNPCNGNIANPPTIPNTAVNDVLHAGHPGVNAANTPPKSADEFVLTELGFTEFIFFI